MDYGAYFTTGKIVAIELPVRHPDSATRNRETKRAKADLLARNLRHYCELGRQKPEERQVLEKAIGVLFKQTK